MVGVDFKRHGHQVGAEFSNGPDDGEALQFGGGVSFFRLVEGARSTADNALLTLPHLREDLAEAGRGCVGVYPEWQAEVWEGSDRAGSEEGLEAVEGVLAIRTPVEDCIFPGKRVEMSGDGGEVFNIMLVVPGEAQE